MGQLGTVVPVLTCVVELAFNLPLNETITLIDGVLQALDAQNADLARTKLLDIGNALRVATVRVGVDETPVNATK